MAYVVYTRQGSDMHMITMRRAFAGIGAGLLLLLTAPSTDATPRPAHSTAADICATGFRGQPDYDHHCLTRGTPADAAYEWYTTYPAPDRKQHCTHARHNGMASVVTETRGDMITDRYRNHRTVLRHTARTGQTECLRRWGIRL